VQCERHGGPVVSDWERLYRWEWFRRATWRGDFRARKVQSPQAVKCLLAGRTAPTVLDCSCGLGLKTIVLRELGLGVCGSDQCAFAVEKAQELARLEGHPEIEFFTSAWAELPKRTDRRFDAVFNDALSWVPTREDFEAALGGSIGVLKPGGFLVFFGAEADGRSGTEHRARLLHREWTRRPRFSVEWDHTDAGTRCTSLLVREKGDSFIDEHHLFLIEECGMRRLESATIRQPILWDWPILVDLVRHAGFAHLETRHFTLRTPSSTRFSLNLATT
jgi:SAM-dependent methyltransferase